MICPNCKKTVNDNSKFCEHCGTKIENAREQVTKVKRPEDVFKTQSQVIQKALADPKTKKRMTGIVAAIAAVVVIILILAATHKSKIDLAEYVKVDFSGYDTYGTAEIDFNEKAFSKEIAKKAKNIDVKNTAEVNNLDNLELYVKESKLTDYYEFVDGFEYEIDKKSGLSNNDVVVVSFKFDNEKVAKFGIKLVGEEVKVEVKGLDKIKEIDPFEGVEIEFSGTSPKVTAQYSTNSTDPVMDEIDYELSARSDIKKGDKITLTVSSNEEEFVEEYGCKFKTVSKEFVCENVDEYVTKLDDINEETLKLMKNQTEDVIEAYFANRKERISKSNLKYEGCYMLYAKNIGTWSDINVVYVIYSATVKSKNKKFDTSKVYMPVKFDDLIKYVDGTEYVDLNVNSISGNTGLSYAIFGEVPGYTSKDDMYSELIAAKKGDYTEEISDALK